MTRTTTPRFGLVKPSYSEMADIGVINANMDTLDSKIFDMIYPVGSIYMSVSSADPSVLFGGTWQRIEGKFLLAATDNGSSGASQAAGNTGGAATVTLTSAQSGIPAHAHGLNSHKHSVGAHSHGLNSHKHNYDKTTSVTGGAHSHGVGAAYGLMEQWGDGRVLYRYKNASSNWTSNYHIWANSGGSMSQSIATGMQLGGSTDSANIGSVSIGTTSTASSAASGSTANSTAFDSGAASGNTANNTAANASAAHENMPPYLSVYVWKRTA